MVQDFGHPQYGSASANSRQWLLLPPPALFLGRSVWPKAAPRRQTSSDELRGQALHEDPVFKPFFQKYAEASFFFLGGGDMHAEKWRGVSSGAFFCIQEMAWDFFWVWFCCFAVPLLDFLFSGVLCVFSCDVMGFKGKARGNNSV